MSSRPAVGLQSAQPHRSLLCEDGVGWRFPHLYQTGSATVRSLLAVAGLLDAGDSHRAEARFPLPPLSRQ